MTYEARFLGTGPHLVYNGLMIAYVFFSAENGPEQRQIFEYIKQLELHQVRVKPIEFNSKEGTVNRGLYDIMDHPAMVLVREDGSLVGKWQRSMPLVSEISYLAHS